MYTYTLTYTLTKEKIYKYNNKIQYNKHLNKRQKPFLVMMENDVILL
jgi:hypothetical protein